MTRCSLTATQEPLAGTAPLARWWWLLEVPGAWGRDPLATCRVPAVRELISTPQRRVLLVRRPGRHPAADPSAPLRVWVAGAMPGDSPTRVAVLDDSRDLLAWDVESPPDEVLTVDPAAPELVVCANARRDLCCGLDGRALAQALDPSRVWECSHLGGHRFAPTALHVAQGIAYGRLDVDVARLLLEDDRPAAWAAPWMRGRTALPAAAQAAEIALLGAGLSPDPAGVSVTDEPDGSVTVRFSGLEPVRMMSRAGEPRPPSCGAEAKAWSAWVAA